MPDFHDMLQCKECGGWYIPGEHIIHCQSHDRLHRKHERRPRTKFFEVDYSKIEARVLAAMDHPIVTDVQGITPAHKRKALLAMAYGVTGRGIVVDIEV